jgi:NAD(P)H-dependent FMN reductase
MPLTISIIYGSVRSQRQGIKAALFLKNLLTQRGHDINLIDPLEYNLPMLDKMYKEIENPDEMLTELSEFYKKSDAFVIVSGEYNHSIPPALKNILDYFMEEYFFKPSAIVTYSAGPFGGVRAGVHLRAIVAELGMPSIPVMFPISKVQDSFDESGVALDESYIRRSKKFLDELEWYAYALKSARKHSMPY